MLWIYHHELLCPTKRQVTTQLFIGSKGGIRSCPPSAKGLLTTFFVVENHGSMFLGVAVVQKKMWVMDPRIWWASDKENYGKLSTIKLGGTHSSTAEAWLQWSCDLALELNKQIQGHSFLKTISHMGIVTVFQHAKFNFQCVNRKNTASNGTFRLTRSPPTLLLGMSVFLFHFRTFTLPSNHWRWNME